MEEEYIVKLQPEESKVNPLGVIGIIWNEMSGGGHFAALEKPRLLIEDIRKFFDKIKL